MDDHSVYRRAGDHHGADAQSGRWGPVVLVHHADEGDPGTDGQMLHDAIEGRLVAQVQVAVDPVGAGLVEGIEPAEVGPYDGGVVAQSRGSDLCLLRLPTIATARAPASRARAPETEPTPPVAAETTTVSPGRGRRWRTCAAYAVRPGIPSAPRATLGGRPAGTTPGAGRRSPPRLGAPAGLREYQAARSGEAVAGVDDLGDGASRDYRSEREGGLGKWPLPSSDRTYGSSERLRTRTRTCPGPGSSRPTSPSAKSSGTGAPTGRRTRVTACAARVTVAARLSGPDGRGTVRATRRRRRRRSSPGGRARRCR